MIVNLHSGLWTLVTVRCCFVRVKIVDDETLKDFDCYVDNTSTQKWSPSIFTGISCSESNLWIEIRTAISQDDLKSRSASMTRRVIQCHIIEIANSFLCRFLPVALSTLGHAAWHKSDSEAKIELGKNYWEAWCWQME